jgi:hypothetical protein
MKITESNELLKYIDNWKEWTKGYKYYESSYGIPMIKLPNEFKCPICGSSLYIKPYFSRKRENYTINGHPMITCQNDEICNCPWRNNKMTWHTWLDTSKFDCVDDNNSADCHPSEEDRIQWIKKYIPIMKIKYPRYYDKLEDLDALYTVKQFFGVCNK